MRVSCTNEKRRLAVKNRFFSFPYADVSMNNSSTAPKLCNRFSLKGPVLAPAAGHQRTGPILDSRSDVVKDD